MVKWWNKPSAMLKTIHTTSHGIVLKHISGDVLFAKWKNGKTVKQLYSPFVAVSFASPSDNGYQYLFFTPSTAAYVVS